MYAIIDFIFSLFGGIAILIAIILACIIRGLIIVAPLVAGLLLMSKGVKNIFFDSHIAQGDFVGAIAFIDSSFIGWSFLIAGGISFIFGVNELYQLLTNRKLTKYF